MVNRIISVAQLLSLCLLTVACTAPPQERLESAWQAAEDERFEDFVAHFTEALGTGWEYFAPVARNGNLMKNGSKKAVAQALALIEAGNSA